MELYILSCTHSSLPSVASWFLASVCRCGLTQRKTPLLPCPSCVSLDYVYLNLFTGWWFGTCCIFPYIGNNHPNWLIFFRGVQTTNQFMIVSDRYDFRKQTSQAHSHWRDWANELRGGSQDWCLFFIFHSLLGAYRHHGFCRGKSFRVSPKWWQCCCAWSISSLAVQHSTFRGGCDIHPGFCR